MNRRFFIAAAASLSVLLSSCALSYENLTLQVMQKSRSGVDMRQKDISMCVLYNDSRDSVTFCAPIADFIGKLSSEYGVPVPLFVQKYNEGTDYSDRTVLADILTSSGADVLLLTIPDTEGESVSGNRFRICAYDGMDRNDNLVMTPVIPADSIFISATSQQLVSLFGPRWVTGVFRVLLYDGDPDWINAFTAAENGLWTAAIDKWLQILETSKSLEKRMAAEYNIALGCYLTGNAELADKWLAQAQNDSGKSATPDFILNLKALINRAKRGQ